MKPRGKSSVQQSLPSRHALNALTAGDPVERSLQNYAKQTPTSLSGVNLKVPPITKVGGTK